MVAAVFGWLPLAAAGFTFADGTSMTCTARGVAVQEYYAGPADPFTRLGRIGLAERTGDGYRITWNQQRLQQLQGYLLLVRS